MIWFSPSEHLENECYFCVNYALSLHLTKTKAKVAYIATLNTVLPVEHNKISPPLNAFFNPQLNADDAMEIDVQSAFESSRIYSIFPN